MENLKSEPFDEREEGEISLDDVSSSEETSYSNSNRNVKRSGIGKKHIKRESGILTQDADHGKENRRYSNELIGGGSKPIAAKLQEKNEDLLPISSDEDIEFVGLPGTSKQLAIHLGPKKKRKKKKKKKSGPRMLVMDDLVSTFDDEPDVLGVVADDRRDFIVSRPYGNANVRSPSPIHRMNSPPRHTGWHLPRSPAKHYHSPLKHSRSPNRRSPSPHHRSPRKFLSPRKPPAFNPDRRYSHKPSRDPSPERYDDAYASSLLKKVRHLETVGSITPVNQQKYKESSLKEKLSKMMIKSVSEVKENVGDQESNIADGRDVVVKTDDDEDLEFLRRKALETKQLKNNIKSDEINGTNNSALCDGGNINVSDDDEEDLQLRMIALRSAVMKKHYDRVQRGVMKKKSDRDIKDESPFRDSLLDSLDSDPDSPIVHTSNVENARVEDMDLDSDIEREKEYSEPYSPTDELSDETLIDRVLPRDETSTNQIPIQDVERNSSNIETLQYPDNFAHYLHDHTAKVSSPYSPSDPTSTQTIDKSLRQEPTIMLRDPRLRRHIDAVTGVPHSPNSEAVFNPTLPVCPPGIPFARTPLNTNINPRSSNLSNLISLPLENHPGVLPSIIPVSSQHTSAPSIDSNATNQFHEIQKMNAKEMNVFIDKVQNNITYSDIVRDLAEYTGEPLYLQGVPDITKDVNKIPTLVNRTLVPVPILKTNKKLQQPLPNKKVDGSGEPAFKSAEMLPVSLQSQSNRSNTSFKPMKLPPVPKKNLLMKPLAAAFNTPSNDELNAVSINKCGSKSVATPDISVDKSSPASGSPDATDPPQSNVMLSTELKTKTRRPRTTKNKSEKLKKSPQKSRVGGKSVVISNEKVNNKITVKRPLKAPEKKESSRKNDKSAGGAKKTDIDPKNKDGKKSDPNKGKHLKSVTNFENKSDENPKKNSCITISSIANSNMSKQKNDVTKKVSKVRPTKNPETNPKKSSLKKSAATNTDDKKRRSSVDEDEEALRAALLASLPKRKKSSDSQSISTSSKSNIESAHSAKRKSSNTKELSKENSQLETTVMLPPTTVPSRSVSKQNITDQKKTTVGHLNGEVAARKRLSTSTDQGPMKKIVKSSVTSSIDTAKILNVAERLVDNEIQRKLALQRVAIDLLCNKAPQNTKTTSQRPATNDSTVSMTPKISASRSLERMIIRIGEESDSDSDGANDEASKVKSSDVSVPSQEINKVPAIPTTDFEKSVEEFLRSQREKQESSITMPTIPIAKQSVATSQKLTSPATSTPLAVRHLPASKQEEYRRLKQRIAEREQQKLNRPIQSTMKHQIQTSSSTECPSTAPAATTSAVVTDSTSSIEMHLKNKIEVQNTDENPPIVSDQQYTPISIRTQITQSAMELLHPTVQTNTTENSDVISTPLLTDIPIKSDPSLLETTSYIADNSSRVDTSICNNHLNEDISNSNSIGSIRPRDKLTIQFPNTRDNGYTRHITINRSNDVPTEPAVMSEVASLGLRILTTDQLNMKFERTHSDANDDETQIADRKLIFNECVQINSDISRSRSITERIVTDSIDTDITTETCKIESNGEIIEPVELKHQTRVDTELPTILPCSQQGSTSQEFPNDDIDATIELDATTFLDDIETTNDPIVGSGTNAKSELSAPARAPELSAKIEIDIQTQLKTLYGLSEHQQRVQLTTWEKELVAKRYVVLHNLTQMAEDLQQWETQADLAAEVQRLRMQLQIAEERLQAQRSKTMQIRPQATLTQTIINEGRSECMKLSKLCQEVGPKVMGATYKIPKTGDQLLKERLREVASMTKQLSKKKAAPINTNEGPNCDISTPLTSNNSCPENFELHTQPTNHDFMINQHPTSVKIENVDPKVALADVPHNTSTETMRNVSMQDDARVNNEVTAATNNDSSHEADNPPFDSQLIVKCDQVNISAVDNNLFKTEDEILPIQPAVSYESVLTASNTPRHMDPNRVLCPYELMGTCSDEACPYNHFDANRS